MPAITFEWSFSIGTLLSLVTTLGALISLVMRFERRIVLLETRNNIMWMWWTGHLGIFKSPASEMYNHPTVPPNV